MYMVTCTLSLHESNIKVIMEQLVVVQFVGIYVQQGGVTYMYTVGRSVTAVKVFDLGENKLDC